MIDFYTKFVIANRKTNEIVGSKIFNTSHDALNHLKGCTVRSEEWVVVGINTSLVALLIKGQAQC